MPTWGSLRLTLAQRKRRFFGLLVERREGVPKWLLLRALGLLAAEAEAAVGDCGRAGALIGTDLGGVLAAIRDFLLRSLAIQNPIYGGADLAELRQVGARALTRNRGRICLRAWPPNGALFDSFCRSQGLLAGNSIGELRRLLTTLGEAKPRPSRLLALLKSMFPEEEAGRSG